MSMRRHLWLLLTLLPHLPALVLGPPPTGHDFPFHRMHLRDFQASLAEGVLYPRWAATPNEGLGAPSFYFYPPLPYYLALPALAVTDDPGAAFHITGAFLTLLSTAALVAWLRPRPGALSAALLWAVLPYPLLTLFHRLAWAEYTWLRLTPLFFLAATRLLAAPRGGRFLALVGAGAALGASHLALTAVLTPFFAAWFAYEALRRRSCAPLGAALAAGTAAALLLGPFLLPVVLDRQEVHLEHITASRHGRYRRNFLLLDETRAGFAPSPFKGVVTEAAAATAGVLLCARLAAVPPPPGPFFFGAGVLFAWALTPLADPLFRVYPPAQVLQFPWRLTGLLSLAAAVLVGLAYPRRRGLLTLSLLAALAVSAHLLYLAYNPKPWMGDFRRFPPPLSKPVFEYVPHRVALGHLLGTLPYDPSRRVFSRRGEGRVETARWTPHRRVLRVRAGPKGLRLTLPVFAYPGWCVRLDHRAVPLRAPNTLGLIEVTVPPGDHVLEVVNRPTPARRWGYGLALAGLALSLLFARLVGGAPFPPPKPGRLFPRPAGPAMALALLAAGVLFPPPTLRPPVVLITAGALRADHGHFNGYIRPTTPNLDYLAWIEGVRFRRAYTPVPAAGPAAAALLVESGVLRAARGAGRPVGIFLGEDLRRESPALRAALASLPPLRQARLPAAEVAARASLWLRAHRDEPFFLWLHFAEATPPFRLLPEPVFTSPPGPRMPRAALPPPLRAGLPAGETVDLAWLRDRYDEALLQVDRAAGRLIQDLFRLGLYDRTLIAVCGLHGLDLGDGPGPPGVGTSLHEVQTAVWLILKYPGSRRRQTVIEKTPVSLRHLGGTLRRALGGAAGPTLEDVLAGREAPVRVVLPGGGGSEVLRGTEIRRRLAGRTQRLRWLPLPPFEAPESTPPKK